jgi:hypothetical protein
MLTDGQVQGGRSGQGFHCANMEPLLHRTARGFVEGLERGGMGEGMWRGGSPAGEKVDR